MLEEAGLETWAVDILAWGFSDLGLFYLLVCVCVCMGFLAYYQISIYLGSRHTRHILSQTKALLLLRDYSFLRKNACFLFHVLERLPPCNVASKCEHFYLVLLIGSWMSFILVYMKLILSPNFYCDGSFKYNRKPKTYIWHFDSLFACPL